MKIGIFSMPEHPPWSNWQLANDLDLEKIVIAEKLGVHEFWVGEHHSGGFEPVPVPEFQIARATAVTSRIKLGTAVVNLPFHDPFMVAERLAYLDQLTHGRLMFGFGSGGLPVDQKLMGTVEDGAERFAEALGVIQRLWAATDRISHHGKFWSFEDRELQVRPLQENPPIAIAGLSSTDKYQLSGANGFIPMSLQYIKFNRPNLAGVPNLVEVGQAIRKGASEAQRDPDKAIESWRIVREVYVAESREAAMRDLYEGISRSYEYVFGVGLEALMRETADQNLADVLSPEYLAENLPMIIGSPEDCIRQIQEMREELGGFTLCIADRSWVTNDLWGRSLERFMRYVAPAFTRSEEQVRRRRMSDAGIVADWWPTEAWTDRPVVDLDK